MKIWSLRAVVTFDRKETSNTESTVTASCIDKNKPKDPMGVTIITRFSVCFQKPTTALSLNIQKIVYIQVQYKDMTDIFSLLKTYEFRVNISKWWDDYKTMEKQISVYISS